MSSAVNDHRIYRSLITTALANWQEEVMYLAFNTSLVWEEYCLIRLCVVHRGRALPLVWRVKKHKSASVSFVDYQEMLEQATGRLPKGVRLHKGDNYGPVHVILGCNNINGEFWAVVSDEKTTLQTFMSTDSVSILKRIFLMTSLVVGISNVRRFGMSALFRASVLSWLWLHFLPLLKVLLSLMEGIVAGSILIGFAVTVIFGLAVIGLRLLFSMLGSSFIKSVFLLILTPNLLWLHAHNIVSDFIVLNSLSTLITTFLHNFCQSISPLPSANSS